MEGAYILPRIASLDKPLRLAVLISGSGSGLEALLNYQSTLDYMIPNLLFQIIIMLRD